MRVRSQRGQAMLEYVSIGLAIVLVLALGAVLVQQILRFNIQSTLDGVSSPQVGMAEFWFIVG